MDHPGLALVLILRARRESTSRPTGRSWWSGARSRTDALSRLIQLFSVSAKKFSEHDGEQEPKCKEVPGGARVGPDQIGQPARLFRGRPLAVELHGGGPLTAGREVIAEILRQLAAQSQVVRVSVQTNGVHLLVVEAVRAARCRRQAPCTDFAAARIVSSTSSGLESMVTWLVSASTVVEPMRLAMKRCSSGLTA